MKAAIYIRVSTDDQTVSLEAQLAKCRAYCELYDLEVVGEFSDSASGKDLNRDGLRAALAAGADALVVMKLDRLTRSTRDMGALIEGPLQRMDLHSVEEKVDTATAAGRLVLNVLMSVAQWERETIAERTSTALQHKRSKGERVGQVPYGFEVAADGVNLIERPEEQTALERINEMRAKGASIRSIAAAMNAEHIEAARGAKWYPTTVSRLLKREENAA